MSRRNYYVPNECTGRIDCKTGEELRQRAESTSEPNRISPDWQRMTIGQALFVLTTKDTARSHARGCARKLLSLAGITRKAAL